MKKLLIAFAILLGAAAVYGFLVSGDDIGTNGGGQIVEQTPAGVRAGLPGTDLMIPELDGQTVTLEARTGGDGTTRVVADYSNPTDPAQRASITVVGEAGQVPVTSAGTDSDRYYAYVPFYANFGGTGTFLYVGLFSVNAEGVLAHHGSLFVDDRVSFESIEPLGDVYAVSYLTRAPGEAMAATPTIPAFKTFSRTNTDFTVLAEYHNATQNDIRVTEPESHNRLDSTFVIEGEARGPWYFEATFPVEIRTPSGETLIETFIMTDEEWMTEDFVPFSEEITVADYTGPATLYLHKQNASGEPERDAWLAIPVTIEG